MLQTTLIPDGASDGDDGNTVVTGETTIVRHWDGPGGSGERSDSESPGIAGRHLTHAETFG